ncbi:mevalonate kinase [candidate division KSB1 bacterium]|nr:mevalonate kinase [candidate division KSB1 bacterium]RQW11094.1 MAG: mevalonate kinase [candidate division KSB1 bacterium]
MRESFRASAPGKLMLLGEHAVLHGHRCIVCAVNQRLRIVVRPRSDMKISIDSDLGCYQSDLKNLVVEDTLRFVLTAIDQHKALLAHGFAAEIESDLGATVGLGSSAAVTAAMTIALFHLAGLDLEADKIFDRSLSTVRAVQGKGSGADLAASVYGGALLYRHQPKQITPLRTMHPIVVVYSGYKTATTDVIRLVENQREKFPGLFSHIYSAMDSSAARAARAINEDDWPTVGELLTMNQGLMSAIGVSDQRLADLVYRLLRDPGILGAKISGSGLGDCVVGLGAVRNKSRLQLLPIEMSRQGVTID